VVQKLFDVSDLSCRQIIIEKIQATLSQIPNAKETPLKHVLKFLQKNDVQVKGNSLHYKKGMEQMGMNN